MAFDGPSMCTTVLQMNFLSVSMQAWIMFEFFITQRALVYAKFSYSLVLRYSRLRGVVRETAKWHGGRGVAVTR